MKLLCQAGLVKKNAKTHRSSTAMRFGIFLLDLDITLHVISPTLPTLPIPQTLLLPHPICSGGLGRVSIFCSKIVDVLVRLVCVLNVYTYERMYVYAYIHTQTAQTLFI